LSLELSDDKQNIDRDWAYQKEDDIAAHIASFADYEPDDFEDPTRVDKLSKVSLVSADCRTTVCRVEFSYKSDPNARELLVGMFGSPPFDGEGYFTKSLMSDNIVTYFSKSGHALPTMGEGT